MDENLNCPVLIMGNERSRYLSERYGYKEWMISRFLNFIPYPEKMLDYIHDGNNIHYYIRVNTLRTNTHALKRRLTEKGYCLSDTILKEVFEIKNPSFGDNKIKNSGNTIAHHNNNDNRYNRRQGSARCLLLTHIPLEINDEARLRQHFRAFGKVTDVQVEWRLIYFL